ncbi:hypothetical protein [Tepidibacter formicigenes]|uniref:Uncharacterized protein n=1 Tax=Tepidibacter formicigenes DSM 15518 TaxID=1123349 RepID=A0A1M6R139_9FIRM|nr:hypothetical protein [Tepidibacter formicigenes]SHK26047.1 hypothetical protein SAMN02744037_01995 [Tepidibacter formicigenes DSM 15518]
MLKLSLLSLFLRTIPEGIMSIFANYVLANKKVDRKKMLVSGILLGISTYLIRFLPIHFGVHTILSIMIYIFLCIKINNIDYFKAISSSIISMIILFVLDWVAVFIYMKVFSINPKILFSKSIISILFGLPSIVIFSIIFFIIYKKNK